MTDSLQTITLGGGCFWCTEAVYVRVMVCRDSDMEISGQKESERCDDGPALG